MNVPLDVNVLLDVFLDREPWVSAARALWAAHHSRRFLGHIAAHGLTILFYIARKIVGAEEALKAVGLCLQTFPDVAVGQAELERAHSLAGNDFEDNLVVACAVHAKLDFIVARDSKGFLASPVIALAPADFLARITKDADA